MYKSENQIIIATFLPKNLNYYHNLTINSILYYYKKEYKMKSPHPHTVLLVADYYLKNQSTVRETARYFGVGKSTIHNYLHRLLPKIDTNLYKKVSALAQLNFSEKHIRGGMSTKRKFS